LRFSWVISGFEKKDEKKVEEKKDEKKKDEKVLEKKTRRKFSKMFSSINFRKGNKIFKKLYSTSIFRNN